MRPVTRSGLAALVVLLVWAPTAGGQSPAPTRAAPVVVGDAVIPRDELQARAQAFGREQFLDVRLANPIVAREAIDARWALQDARAAGVLPDDAAVDGALTRAARGVPLERITSYYGLTLPQLRERVRGELAARALADRALGRSASARAYGRSFTTRALRRRAKTTCRSPFAPLDRCRRGRDSAGERTLPLGVGELRGRGNRTFSVDLASLLGLEHDPMGRTMKRAGERLRRAIARTSRPLERRIRIDADSYEVQVSGRSADLIAAARIAHLLVRDRPPVVLL